MANSFKNFYQDYLFLQKLAYPKIALTKALPDLSKAACTIANQ
jgi:hypothetical protein